jgi:hypothetical protein
MAFHIKLAAGNKALSIQHAAFSHEALVVSRNNTGFGWIPIADSLEREVGPYESERH